MMRPSPVLAAAALFFFSLIQFLPVGMPRARAAEAATGLVAVSANVDGARVLIDGQEVGVTPVTAVVEAGTRTVRIEAPGHDPFSRTIEVPAGKKVLVEAMLVRVASALELRINVDGATAYLDGQPVGQGRRVLVDPVQPGTHLVRVEKPGFETWQGKVTVFRGQLVTVPVELASAFGSLVIESDPPGARVWVDGQERGKAPLTLDGLENGLHGIRLAHPGHADVYQSVRVERQRRAQVRIALPTAAGDLKLRASPGRPRLFLNGVDLGEHAELLLTNVAAGTHNVRASMPGYTDAVAAVHVVEGREAEVFLKLVPVGAGRPVASVPAVASPPARRAVPWVILGVAVAAGAGIGIAAAVEAQQAAPSADPVTPPDATVGISLP